MAVTREASDELADLHRRVLARQAVATAELLPVVRAGYAHDERARQLLHAWLAYGAPASKRAAADLLARWRAEAPDDWVVTALAAHVALQLRRREEAAELGSLLAAQAGDDPIGLRAAAIVALALHDVPGARDRWLLLHERHPGSWPDLEVDALIAFVERRWSDLEVLARSEIEQRPDAPAPHERLGLALHQLDRRLEAKAELERARALDPNGLLGHRRPRVRRLAPAAVEDRAVVEPSKFETLGGLIDPDATGVRLGWLARQLTVAVLVLVAFVAVVAAASAELGAGPRALSASLAIVAGGGAVVALRRHGERADPQPREPDAPV